MSNSNTKKKTAAATLSTIAIIAALGLVATIFAVPQAADAAPKAKVTICHVPEDDPTTPENESLDTSTKTINFKAAAKHLQNHEGDFAGPCPET